MGHDEGAARRDGVAHQAGEQLVRLGGVVDVHLQQRASSRVHRRVPELVRVHLAEALVALQAAGGGALRVDLEVARALLLGEQPVGASAEREAVERRLRDVEVAALDQARHVAPEEGQQQRADVGAVHVRVRHDDDLVVAQLGLVVALPEAGPEGGDDDADLLVREHLLEARLLDVQDLAAQRQDRLRAAVARGLGRAAGRVTFDEVDLR